jgi:hypothetical protein
MFQCAKLLKHKIHWFTLWLWTSLYGSRSVRLQDLDFDRKQLKVVQGKGKKDRYVLTFIHLIHYKIHQSRKNQDYLSTASLS